MSAMRTHRSFWGILIAGSLLFAGGARAITMDELAKKIEALEAQNAALQVKVQKLEAAQAQQSAQLQPNAPAPAVSPSPATASAVTQPATAAASDSAAAVTPSESSTTVGSYGEIGYTRPTMATDKTNVNVGRAVIFIGH
jgi:outer membrane murein-binding lipoprotein Lpp